MTGILLRPMETRDFIQYFCLSYAVNYSVLCSELVLTLPCVYFGVIFFKRPPRAEIRPGISNNSG